MSRKLRLTKIELETKDGKKVSLSLDEARDLHDQLHDLFGKKDTVYIPYTPLPPVIIERDRYPWRNPCTPYWIATPSTCDKIPLDSPPIITCEVRSDSGLKVGYSGSTV